MTCVSCGQSALGRAVDGRAFCHRKECICWKTERMKAAAARQVKVQEVLKWAKKHNLWEL